MRNKFKTHLLEHASTTGIDRFLYFLSINKLKGALIFFMVVSICTASSSKC